MLQVNTRKDMFINRDKMEKAKKRGLHCCGGGGSTLCCDVQMFFSNYLIAHGTFVPQIIFGGLMCVCVKIRKTKHGI